MGERRQMVGVGVSEVEESGLAVAATGEEEEMLFGSSGAERDMGVLSDHLVSPACTCCCRSHCHRRK